VDKCIRQLISTINIEGDFSALCSIPTKIYRDITSLSRCCWREYQLSALFLKSSLIWKRIATGALEVWNTFDLFSGNESTGFLMSALDTTRSVISHDFCWKMFIYTSTQDVS